LAALSAAKTQTVFMVLAKRYKLKKPHPLGGPFIEENVAPVALNITESFKVISMLMSQYFTIRNG
jgi:hypothetical protein